MFMTEMFYIDVSWVILRNESKYILDLCSSTQLQQLAEFLIFFLATIAVQLVHFAKMIACICFRIRLLCASRIATMPSFALMLHLNMLSKKMWFVKFCITFVAL